MRFGAAKVAPPASALEDAYRRHAAMVHRRARQLLSADDEAHEVVQEIFLSLLDRPEQFSGKSSMTTWLYSATTHFCLNRIRDRKNRARLLEERVAPVESDASAPAADGPAVLRDLLARLPDDLAQVAVYYYGDEMTHEEIAAVMGCSRRHVGNLLARLSERVLESERREDAS